jgi:hypothetical protein
LTLIVPSHTTSCSIFVFIGFDFLPLHGEQALALNLKGGDAGRSVTAV